MIVFFIMIESSDWDKIYNDTRQNKDKYEGEIGYINFEIEKVRESIESI